MAKSLLKRKAKDRFRKKSRNQPVIIAEASFQQSSALLQLPPEIKRQVFEYVFAGAKIIIAGQRWVSGGGTFAIARTVYPVILLVCKQLYHEMRPIFGSNQQLELADSLEPGFETLSRDAVNRYSTHYRVSDIPFGTQQAYFSDIKTIIFGSWIFKYGLCFDLSKVAALKLVVLESEALEGDCLWLHATDCDPHSPPLRVRQYAKKEFNGDVSSLLTSRTKRQQINVEGLASGPGSPEWDESEGLYVLFGSTRQYDVLITPIKGDHALKDLPARKLLMFDDKSGKRPRGMRPGESEWNTIRVEKSRRCVVM